jgi:hypothetical protein
VLRTDGGDLRIAGNEEETEEYGISKGKLVLCV